MCSVCFVIFGIVCLSKILIIGWNYLAVLPVVFMDTNDPFYCKLNGTSNLNKDSKNICLFMILDHFTECCKTGKG